jgi:hypothetical protein
MKKSLTVVFGLAAFFLFGFILGIRFEKRASVAAIELYNQSGATIMTAVANHDHGSALAANIGKNKKGRISFLTKGRTSYSLKVTFPNNKTVYSNAMANIKNGDCITVIVTDTTIVPLTTGKL